VWARLEVIAFILLCSLGPLAAGWEASTWGDLLSPVDANSEANTLREVDGFRAEGLTRNVGLGNVLYGDRYLRYGFAASGRDRETSVTPSGVYTHYPPGPEYILFAAEGILGPSPVSRLRVVPVVLCWAAAIYFGFSIRRRFGARVGWLVMAACTVQPLFSDADFHLHYVGYALALQLITIGMCLRDIRWRLPLFIAGFLQGWLSFDYVFIVAFTPLIIEFALPHIETGPGPRWRLGLWRSVMTSSGFVAAHVLHFVQVSTYFGSVAAALHDLGGAAQYRAGARAASDWLSIVNREVFLGVAYLFGNHPITPYLWHYASPEQADYHVFRVFGFAPALAWVGTTGALWIGATWLWPQIAGRRGLLLRDWLVVSVLGLATSSLWIAVMTQHAAQHWQILCRHLFFAYFLCVIFIAVRWDQWRADSVESSRADVEPLQSQSRRYST
jgi:hypothetical protein